MSIYRGSGRDFQVQGVVEVVASLAERGKIEMIGRRISMGLVVLAVSGVVSVAQTPVLANIEAPYPAVQGTVRVAGQTYGPGAVAYGPVVTPLVLTGSDLGTTGTIEFIAYKNGVVDTNVQPAIATPTMWMSNMIFVPVPSGAYSGMIQLKVEGKSSNLLPFLVTPGVYAGTCPAGPATTQLQIITAALNDGTVGQSYSAMLSATGGTQSYTWSVASGTLPAGLSLNASTGTISGTPTTAISPATVTFEVTDSSAPRQNNQAVLDLTVEPQQMTAETVYSYSATYDDVGNVTQYQDTVMGEWNFTFDTLNRLESGSAVSGGSGSQDFTGENLCWAYDSFGNRTAEVMQPSACPSSESSVTPAITYTSSNQLPSSIYQYDAAGDVTADFTTGNSYLYDAEGRVCAVRSEAVPGTYTMTGYLYDANGVRVAKGSIQNMNTCDPSPVSQGGNGFQFTENYVLGPSGEELTVLNGNNNWQRTNVYAAGKLIGTYDAAGLHFHLEDPLGTRRMQVGGNLATSTNPATLGQPETDIQSLPYGDGLYSFPDQYAPATADDSTPLHFTGKERDSESGNDYFFARYYSSAMGRFLSPDWSAKAQPVP
jgi:RHS repeat-associated protein